MIHPASALHRDSLRRDWPAIVLALLLALSVLAQVAGFLVMRRAARNAAETVLARSDRLTETVMADFKDLRRSVNEFAEKYAWLSARTALLDRTRRNASTTDVRELRARLDAMEINIRNHQRTAAEDRATLSDLLTRIDQRAPDRAALPPSSGAP